MALGAVSPSRSRSPSTGRSFSRSPTPPPACPCSSVRSPIPGRRCRTGAVRRKTGLMRPDGLHHVSLNVRDVPAALDFYTRVLGLTERGDRPDFSFGGAWLDAGGQQIHLIEADVPAVARPALRAGRVRPGRGGGGTARAGRHGDRSGPGRHRAAVVPRRPGREPGRAAGTSCTEPGRGSSLGACSPSCSSRPRLACPTWPRPSASASAGSRAATRLRVALVFGAFETGMPIVGLVIGAGLATGIGQLARWIGAGLLIILGGGHAAPGAAPAGLDGGGQRRPRTRRTAWAWAS